jgi:hypothetical protein
MEYPIYLTDLFNGQSNLLVDSTASFRNLEKELKYINIVIDSCNQIIYRYYYLYSDITTKMILENTHLTTVICQICY